MSAIDRRCVVAGIVTGLFFALPASVVQRIAGSGSVLATVMVALIVFSGALAGFAAARPLPPMPLVHGAIAGAVTLLGPQIVYSIWSRTLPNPVALVFWLLCFASLGTMGAWVALWSARNRAAGPAGGTGTTRGTS